MRLTSHRYDPKHRNKFTRVCPALHPDREAIRARITDKYGPEVGQRLGWQ